MNKRTSSRKARSTTRYKPKRRSRFAKYIRVLFTLTTIAGILFCVGAVISKAAKPYLISCGESREIAAVKKEIAEACAENRALKGNIAYLSTPRGKEAEARKLGWVKEGEVALVVEQPQKPGSEGARAEGVSDKSFWRSAGQRILELFTRPADTGGR